MKSNFTFLKLKHEVAYWLLTMFLCAILAGCSDEDPVVAGTGDDEEEMDETPFEVSSFFATEVEQTEGANSVEIKFNVTTLESVEEFRVLFAKTSPANALTVENILALDEDSYTSFTPSDQTTIEFTLDASQRDSDGDFVVNDFVYQVFLFVKGLDEIVQGPVSRFENLEKFHDIDQFWVHDAGNDHNAGDVKLLFETNSGVGVNELQIFLAKQNPSTATTEEHLSSLSSDYYTLIDVADEEVDFDTYLSESQLDTDGESLSVDQPYFIYVYSPELDRYSQISSALELTDNNIVEGRYFGTWDDNLFEGIPISLELTHTSGNQYDGPIYISLNWTASWGGETDGSVTFDIDQDDINLFEFDQLLPDYAEDGCPGYYSGPGTIDDEFNMDISFTGDDCDGHHIGTLVLERFWKY